MNVRVLVATHPSRVWLQLEQLDENSGHAVQLNVQITKQSFPLSKTTATTKIDCSKLWLVLCS